MALSFDKSVLKPYSLRSMMLKASSLALSMLLVSQNLVWAVSGDGIFAGVRVPSRFGCKGLAVLRAVPDQPVVVLINDMHCHAKAQENIARILDTVIRDYKVDLVCVEGASGLVDTSVFQSMPHQEAREKACREFLHKGYLSAAEALSIERGPELPFTLWGVEDEKLYVEDLARFRETLNNVQAAKQFLKASQRIIGQLKGYIYNQKFRAFDTVLQQYRRGEITLTDWIDYLRPFVRSFQDVKHRKISHLGRILQVIDGEKAMNVKAVPLEQALLIREMEKQLAKEDLRELIQQTLLFKLAKISPIDYYTYLEPYIDTFSSLSLPNLSRYIALLKIQSQIDIDSLNRQLDTIVQLQVGRHSCSRDERELYEIDRKIGILERLYNLKMNREDFRYYTQHQAEFSLQDLAQFIVIQAGVHGFEVPDPLRSEDFIRDLENKKGPAEVFYALAQQRDQVLVKNVIQKMQHDDKKRAVLVAGGFHRTGIQKQLERQGISCVVITPQIPEGQEENPYISLMMDEKLEVEGLLANHIALPLLVWQWEKGNEVAKTKEFAQAMVGHAAQEGDLKALVEELQGNPKQQALFGQLVELAGDGMEHEGLRRLLLLQEIGQRILSFLDNLEKGAQEEIVFASDAATYRDKIRRAVGNQEWPEVAKAIMGGYVRAEAELEMNQCGFTERVVEEIKAVTVVPLAHIGVDLLSTLVQSSEATTVQSTFQQAEWLEMIGEIERDRGNDRAARELLERAFALGKDLFWSGTLTESEEYACLRLITDTLWHLQSQDELYKNHREFYSLLQSMKAFSSVMMQLQTIGDIDKQIEYGKKLLERANHWQSQPVMSPGRSWELPIVAVGQALDKLERRKREIEEARSASVEDLKIRVAEFRRNHGIEEVRAFIREALAQESLKPDPDLRVVEFFRALRKEYMKIQFQVRDWNVDAYRAVLEKQYVKAYTLYQNVLAQDLTNEEAKEKIADVSFMDKVQAQQKAIDAFEATQAKARRVVETGSIPEILSAMEAAVVQGEAVLLQEFIVAFLTSQKSDGLSFQNLLRLVVYMRYADSWDVARRRWIGKILDLRVRAHIAQESVAEDRVQSPEDQVRTLVEKTLIDQCNVVPGQLMDRLGEHIDASYAKQIMVRFFARKYDLEAEVERIAFELNTAKEEGDTSNPDIVRARQLLAGSDTFNKWLHRRGSKHRLTLNEKMALVDEYVEKHTEALEGADKTEPQALKLAVAVIHFKDRFDIELDVPLEGMAKREDLSKDGDGKPLALLRRDQLGRLLPHLILIDCHLDKIPYTFTGLSMEIRRILVTKGGRAFYHRNGSGSVKPYHETADKSYVMLAVPVDDPPGWLFRIRGDSYIDTLYHEQGHGIAGEYMGVPFSYSIEGLITWLQDHGYDGRLDAGQRSLLTAVRQVAGEQMYGLKDADTSKQSGELLFQAVTAIFRDRQKQYKETRARLLEDLAKSSFEDLCQKIGWEEDLSEQAVPGTGAIVKDYTEGRGKHDSQYADIQPLLNMNPQWMDRLSHIDDVAKFFMYVKMYMNDELYVALWGEMPDRFASFDPPGYNYIYRVPKGDSGHRLEGEWGDKQAREIDRFRNNANEFVAEFFRVFMQAPEELKARNPAIYNLFSLIVGGPRMSQGRFLRWASEIAPGVTRDTAFASPTVDEQQEAVRATMEVKSSMDRFLEREKATPLDLSSVRVIQDHIMTVLVSVLHGEPVREGAFKRDIRVLLDDPLIPFDFRVALIGKLVQLARVLGLEDSSVSWACVSGAIGEEIVEAAREKGLPESVSQCLGLKWLLLDLAKIQGIPRDKVKGLYDAFEGGIITLIMYPGIDLGNMGDSNTSYHSLITQIADITGISPDAIVRAFKPEHFSGRRVNIVPAQGSALPNELRLPELLSESGIVDSAA